MGAVLASVYSAVLGDVGCRMAAACCHPRLRAVPHFFTLGGLCLSAGDPVVAPHANHAATASLAGGLVGGPYRWLAAVDPPNSVLRCAHGMVPVLGACFVERDRPTWRWPLAGMLQLSLPPIALICQHRPFDILFGTVVVGIGMAVGETLNLRERPEQFEDQNLTVKRQLLCWIYGQTERIGILLPVTLSPASRLAATRPKTEP